MSGGGSKKGERRGGRKIGSRNRRTIEREKAAQLALERDQEIKRLRAEGAKQEIAAAAVADHKLMKEIAFEFAHLFREMAMVYRPWPAHMGKNPNENEAKFKECAKLAVDTALGAASYESPKLSTAMVGQAVVTEIKITGGLPDELDGGLCDAASEHVGSSIPDATKASEKSGRF